jgi:hypothetical protein
MHFRRASSLLAMIGLALTITNGRIAAAPPAPALLSPANGASVTVPLTISWSTVSDPAGIIGYNYQISRSSSFSTLTTADSTGPNVTQDVVSGLTAGTYFWRVQAASGIEQGAWSQPRSFVVTGAGPGTPGTPTLQPTRGYATFHPWESIHFDWTVVPDAVTYRLEVSNDPNFEYGPGITTFWNDNIPTNSDGYVHTMVGNWYARVFAVNADNPQEGIRSLPSNVIEFSCFYNNPIGPPPVLQSPVDNPTLTLPVTVIWAHVPNPQSSGYVLEIANDPGFSNIEWFFNQYTEPSQEMLSLSSGPKFWRVASQHGMASPTTAAVTDWSTTGRFTISSAPATPVSVRIQGTPGFEYSGAERRVAVQLTAETAASVALSSSHPALAPVPATLAMSGTAFNVIPIRFGQVTTPTVITLTATLNGASTSSQFTLRPPTLNNETLQPTVRATGGATISGWIDLEGGGLAGPAGFTVNMSTNSPAASVPASVTIPAGVSGTGFSIQTSPVDTTTVVTITATAAGVTNQWQITLTPSAAPTSFWLRPMSTTNGSQGVVTSADGVGHDQIMQVASSNPALASVPSTVSVSGGSGVGFFDVSTAPVSEPTLVTISVSGGGVTLSHPLTLYPTLPPLSSVSVSPGTVAGGATATGTVTLGGPAPPNGVAINLSSNQPKIASVPASVTVPGGATSATFTVTTFPSFMTSVQLNAQMDTGFVSTAITVSPSAPTASLSAVSVSPTSLTGGNSATGTVSLSAAAPGGGATVSLSDNSSAVTTPASVLVPGGSTGATFAITTSAVTANTSATITAAYAGTTRTAILAVNAPASSTPAAPTLVSPANAATGVAQPVRLDWNDVANAVSYEVQVDNSSTISAPFLANPTVSVSEAIVSGLPAQRVWWRVRARNAAGVFGPFSSTRRFTPLAGSGPATLSAVSVSPSTVVGGNGATGTATLSAAAPSGGAVVSLASSNTAVATAPASVTVAAGASSATFPVTTSAVATNTPVTITATYSGTSRTATLTATPVPPAASLQGVSVSPTSVTGGSTAQGTVTFSSGAPSGGALVSLTSSNTAAATVPASVTVAGGATSATFTVSTSSVAASTPITLSATYSGVTRTAALTVTPPSQAVTLTVTATGRSGERVTSSPAGINVSVGSSGSASFTAGASITLSVTNGRDAIWSGACSSGGNKQRTCTFTITGNATVAANVQ